MVLCQGRPDGLCPDRKNDSSVKLCQGDLMLCASCETFRFPEIGRAKATVANTKVCGDSKNRAQTSSPVSNDMMQPDKLIQCELLFFVNDSYDKHPESTIKSTIIDFYREDEVMQAKVYLVSAAEGIDGLNVHTFAKNRIGVNKVRSTVDDIMNIVKLIDEGGYRDMMPTFCAVSRSRIPLITDEQSDIVTIRLELSKLRQHVEMLSAKFSSIKQCKCCITEASQAHAAVRDAHGHVDPDPDNVIPTVQSVVDNGNTEHALPAPVDDMDIGRTFAETVQDNMDGFQQVNSRARQKKNKGKRKIVVGELKADAPFQGVSKKAVVCISRLTSETTADEVTEYLRTKGINVFSCYGYADKFGRAWSFMRVCVSQTDVNKLFVANLWPDGVVVRPWSFKPRQPDQVTNS